MNIKVEAGGPCLKNVTVEYSAEEISGEFAETLAQFVQYAQLPGFRAGRAPRDLVRRRFAAKIAEDVKERVMTRGFQEAVRQEKLQTINVQDVKDEPIEEGHPFTFTVKVEVAPDFELPSYQGMPLSGNKVSVADDEVEKALGAVRERSGKFQDVTGRPLQKGDLALIDYTGTVDGQPVTAVAPAAKGLDAGKDFWLYADEEHEFLPGLSAGLAGIAPGESRQVNVTFPAGFVEAALAGKTAVYDVQLKGLRERKPAEMDAAFFQQLGVADEADLRGRIRKDLEGMKQDEERGRLQGEVIKQLLVNTQLELPPSIVQQETSYEVYDIVQANTRRGVSKDLIQEKKDEIIDMAARSAAERVKLRFILQKIARQEKIEATDEDVRRRVALLAQRSGTSPDRMMEELTKNESLPRVRDEVVLNKALQWVLDQAAVSYA